MQLKCTWLAKEIEIARILNKEYSTARLWIREYNNEGLDELRYKPKKQEKLLIKNSSI
ncbi:helix-turn-helix domain-containing protein [Saccharolobus caldissimus]|uniref:Helix-turn-helix domain-containing protein n=1 Tax=Saccharolobus caldissimus TaxID=1702097 RepID=A0AAQ4CS73_9CREN|nr:helix-turn-helix domain-containing protein [Saccharolobus caldissimus]BDB98654.1 hypothetical protein SACC_16710 [Saccharolobus caldissimus]